MWYIIIGIGIILIIAGVSKKFVLIGTNSPMGLVAIGVAVLIWGIVQVVRSRRQV